MKDSLRSYAIKRVEQYLLHVDEIADGLLQLGTDQAGDIGSGAGIADIFDLDEIVFLIVGYAGYGVKSCNTTMEGQCMIALPHDLRPHHLSISFDPPLMLRHNLAMEPRRNRRDSACFVVPGLRV